MGQGLEQNTEEGLEAGDLEMLVDTVVLGRGWPNEVAGDDDITARKV